MMTTWVMKWVQKEKLSVSRESFELGCGGRGTGAGGAGSVYLSCSCQFRCWCQTDWSPPLTELTGTQETCHLSPDPLRPDITGGRAGTFRGAVTEQIAGSSLGKLRQISVTNSYKKETPPPLDDTELWHCHTSDNRKLSQILCLLLWPPLTRHRWPVTTNSQSVKENRREILMFISPSGEMEILSLYNCQLTFICLQCPTINIVYNSKI